MGNNESSIELDDSAAISSGGKNNYYLDRYNLVPSYRNNTYDVIDKNFFNKKTGNDVPDYMDLRKTFPSIIDVRTLPFNPIACVSYLLEYSLLKNELNVFPPSLMFIYKHCHFFKGASNLISFETIFNAIRSKGFCIETEFRTTPANLSSGSIPNDLYEKAIPYKFIKVYKVLNNLQIIKTVLSNDYPILVGFSIYSKLTRISDQLVLPDHSTQQNLGGMGGVLVGYIEDREMFIMAQTYGNNFGQNGYLLVPYDYILNKNYTFEMYVLDIVKKRVDGYMNHNKPVLSLPDPGENTSSGGFLSNLFS
tara:strand:- start:139 stop:1059 length:921 start_codon:yes stop_codon:yes gene_type:complete